MNNNFHKYRNQFLENLKSFENEVLSNEETKKNSVFEFVFLLNECSMHLMSLEERAFLKLAKQYPNDEEVWYLYSRFILINKNDLEFAFSLSEKSIDILIKMSKTVSAFSKHYIELAIKLEKLPLAISELERISILVNLSLEQKRYFLESLKVLDSRGCLPHVYKEALLT